MTRLPRNVQGRKLASELERLGYSIVHQTGSHIICRTEHGGKHTEVIPDHKALKTGTLSSILGRVAVHAGISRDELIELMELKSCGWLYYFPTVVKLKLNWIMLELRGLNVRR